MEYSKYLVGSVIALVVLLTGCTSGQQATGTITLKITDAALNVTSLQLTISEIDVHLATTVEEMQLNETVSGEETNDTVGAEETNETDSGTEVNDTTTSGWIKILNGPKVVDLVDVKNLISLLGENNLTAGKYTQMRIIIKSAVAVIDNVTYNVTVPSSALRFNHQFNIVENKTTSIIFDFDADRSILLLGNKVILKPVAKSLTEFTAVDRNQAENEMQRQAAEASQIRQSRQK